MLSTERRVRVRWFSLTEATAVFCLIMLHIWWVRFVFPSFWIAILGLILLSHHWRGEEPWEIGFRWDTFAASLTEYLPFVLFLALLLAMLGTILRSMRNITWESACASLLFYCLWGLFQQYLLNGYFVKRFAEFFDRPASNHVATLAAVFFACAHQPNWFLVIVTFVGGYLAAKAYLKHGNLYFLGLAHGIIGFLIYLVVPDSISHHLYVGPKWYLAGR